MNQLSAQQDGNNVANVQSGCTGLHQGNIVTTMSNQSYLYTVSRGGRCKLTPVSSFFSGWQLVLVGCWGEGGYPGCPVGLPNSPGCRFARACNDFAPRTS